MISTKNYFVLLYIVLILSSCEDEGTNPGNYEYEDQIFDTLVVNGQTLLDIQNTNGTISILGDADATNFSLEITRNVKSYRSSASAEDHINDITISYNSSPDILKINVDHPHDGDLDYQVDFKITGPIIFDYRAILGNGNVDINSITRNMNVTVGNGNANLDVILLNNCALAIETGNGNVELTIPDITNAVTFATIGNGTITTTGLVFENLVTTNTSLHGILGNGEGTINILLGNGNIALIGY